MIVAALLIGTVWPSLVYRFREQPSASTLDRPSIEHNQAATLKAFGLDHDITTQEFGATCGTPTTTSVARARQTAQIRLLDPDKLTPTFNVKQEIQGYYQFKTPLDIAHYPLGARDQDVAIAVRELNLSGISAQLVVEQPPDLHPRVRRGGGADRPHGREDRDADLHQRRSATAEPDPGRRAADLLRPALPVVLHRRPAPGQHQERRVRLPEHQRHLRGRPHDVHRRRRRADRLAADPAAVRRQAARPEHLLRQRDQLRLAAADRPRPAQPGGQGRAVADPRRRRLPRARRRHGAVGGRRLHLERDLPRLRADQPAPGDVELADERDGHREPAEQAGQLPAELGEGRRRRLHRDR